MKKIIITVIVLLSFTYLLSSCSSCEDDFVERTKIESQIKALNLDIQEIEKALAEIDPFEEDNLNQFEALGDELVFLIIQQWMLEEQLYQLKQRSKCF